MLPGALSVRAMRSESRLTTRARGRSRDDPSSASRAAASVSTARPLTSTSTSPTWSPAASAGLRLTTAPTVGGPSDSRAPPPSPGASGSLTRNPNSAATRSAATVSGMRPTRTLTRRRPAARRSTVPPARWRCPQRLERPCVHHRPLAERHHEVAVLEARGLGRRLLHHFDDDDAEAFAQPVLLGDLLHLLLREIPDAHAEPSP